MLYKKEDKIDLNILIGLSKTTKTIHRRSETIFKEYGLTISQFAVLEALYHKGDMTVNEIIEAVLSTGGNITVVINNLEKEGLVERRVNPNDKRSSLISVTQAGKGKVEAIFPPHVEDLKDFLSVYSEEEKSTLLALLKKLRK